MPEITEEKLKARMHQIEQVAEQYKIDNIEDIVNRVKEEYKKVSDELVAKNRRLPEIRIFNSALGKVCADLGAFAGERFEIFILGYSRPKDWNAVDREAVLKAWTKGPKARDNLVKSKKVMQMMKQGKLVVVSRIDKYDITKGGEMIITSGKELEGDEEPIPRDTNKTLADKKTPNRGCTRPLNPRWSITMYGVAKVDDENLKRFEARIYGKSADPSHDNYLPKMATPFESYKAILVVDEDKTTENVIKFTFLSAIEPIEEELSSAEIIYLLLDQGIILSYRDKKEAWDNESKVHPFLVDLDDLELFHKEISCVYDEEGNVKKSKGGYDNTYWDRIGIGIYYLYGASEAKTGNLALRFRDWTNSNTSGFTNEVTQHLKINPNSLPREVIVSFRTTRKLTRWDKENKVAIDDKINGDVLIGSIMGLKFSGNLEGE